MAALLVIDRPADAGQEPRAQLKPSVSQNVHPLAAFLSLEGLRDIATLCVEAAQVAAAALRRLAPADKSRLALADKSRLSLACGNGLTGRSDLARRRFFTLRPHPLCGIFGDGNLDDVWADCRGELLLSIRWDKYVRGRDRQGRGRNNQRRGWDSKSWGRETRQTQSRARDNQCRGRVEGELGRGRVEVWIGRVAVGFVRVDVLPWPGLPRDSPSW